MSSQLDASGRKNLKDYSGEFTGTVAEVSGDPKKGLKIRVRVHPIFDGVPVQDLPLAVYKLPYGCRTNDGVFFPVRVGDRVWCDFPFEGDTRRPRITGSVHESPDGQPLVPAEAFAGQGKAEAKRQGQEPMPEEPQYHEDVVLRQHGVMVTITKQGAIRIVHAASGSNVEVTKSGEIVLHAEAKAFTYAKKGLEAVYDDTVNVKATESRIKSPQTYHTGDVYIYGKLEIMGDADGAIGDEHKKANTDHTGSYKLHGPMEIDQALTVKADSVIQGVLTVAGLNFSGEGGGGGFSDLGSAVTQAQEAATTATGAAGAASQAASQASSVLEEVTGLAGQVSTAMETASQAVTFAQTAQTAMAAAEGAMDTAVTARAVAETARDQTLSYRDEALAAAAATKSIPFTMADGTVFNLKLS